MANEESFLGRGWAFPPAFTHGGAEVAMVAGAEDVHESLRILLGTLPGERVMQEEFGCDLPGVQFEEMDQGLVNTMTRMIGDAILEYEPRVTLDQLEVDDDEAVAGLLLIRIDYTIRATNSRYNMVYPFYLNEAVVPVV